MCAVHAVVDGDEAHTLLGEGDLGEHSDLQVVSAHSRQVFGDHALDLSVFHAVHHLHEAGSLKIRPAPSVVHEKAAVQKSIIPCKGFKDAFLVLNGQTLALLFIVLAQSCVKGCDRGLLGGLS